MPYDLTPPKTAALAGYVTVSVVLNPFSNDHRVSARFAAGQTIEDLVAMLVPDEGHRDHLSAFVGGDYVSPHLWGKVTPKAGSSVFLKAVPADPITILAVLAPIAGTAGAAALGFTAGTLAAGLVAAGISFAILAVGQALFGPSAPNRQRFEESPTFSITGARNGLTPFAPVPIVLGTHKFVPPYGAAPYTEVINNQQYLRFVVVWGYGPVDVTDVRIGNTPITDFEEVEIEDDFAGASTSLGLYPSDVSQEGLSIRLTEDLVTRRTAAATDEFGLTITFPSGLARFDDGGDRQSRSVTLLGEFRLVGDTEWISFMYARDGQGIVYKDGEFFGLSNIARSFSYGLLALEEIEAEPLNTEGSVVTDKTTQVLRWSIRVTDLPSGEYDVRIRRSGAEASLTNDKVRDRADWTALRSFNTGGDPILLEGVAKSAYRIKASDQLNGVVDQLNGIVSTKIPLWTGSAWDETSGEEGVTSNPAAIYRFVLRGQPNPRPVVAANVDDAGLGVWFATCEAQGYKFDFALDFSRPVRDLLTDIANAGKASPAYIDDQWSVIEEKPRTTLVQHFTPRNSRNFSGALSYPTIPQALRIRFANAEKGYLEDERTVYDDDFDETNATVFEVIDLAGQTDPENVYKLGRHYLAAARLRPERFSLEVDVENLVATRGDLCRLTHDVALIGLASGRIRALGADTVTIDETVSITAGVLYRLRVRDDDGDSVTFDFRATFTQSTNVLPITPSGVAAGDLFMFGISGSESLEVLVAGVEYLDDLAASLTLVPYSPEVYDSADAIPPYQSNLSDPLSASFTGPPLPRITDVITDEAALAKTASGDLIPRILVYISAGLTAPTADGLVTPTESLQVRSRRSGTADPYSYAAIVAVDTDFAAISDVVTGEGYDIEVRAIGPVGETSGWVSQSGVQVLGAIAPPPAINTFGINTIGDHTYVEWTYADIRIDVVAYEIRYHPEQDVTLWSRMSALSSEVPQSARAFTVPSRSGSYGIKAIDVLGNKSPTALYVNASLEDPTALNAVQTYVEDPAFGGASDGLFNNDGVLQLGSAGAMSDWATLAEVELLSLGAGEDEGLLSSGTYTFGETDLGSVQTERVTVDMDLGIVALTGFLSEWATLSAIAALAGGATGDDVAAYIEIAYSLDDVSSGQVYSAYRRFVVGDYTARHVKFRVTLTSRATSQSPTVEALTVNVAMPEEIRQGDDVTSGVGTKTVSFSPEFFGLQSVAISAQNMQTGDFYDIASKTRAGFAITFRNSGGAAVDRTFDYVAVGYGRERAT